MLFGCFGGNVAPAKPVARQSRVHFKKHVGALQQKQYANPYKDEGCQQTL
jgi:hypothetical protein